MVTWETNIDVIDIDQKTMRVTGTRTDGEDVQVFPFEGTYANNQEATYANVLWDLYQQRKIKDASIAAIKSAAEATITADLDARESA